MLEGTYRLVSSTQTFVETGEVVDNFGKRPSGFITYGADGRMLVLVVADRNDRPAPASVGAITDADRADLFRTMVAYAGTYTFNGDAVEHRIDVSWNEAWTGTTLVRAVRRDGERIVFTAPAAPSPADGRMCVMTIVWQRIG
jgi:hypothetical protein